jgi:DNA-binding transcriptional ArsR family regulator
MRTSPPALLPIFRSLGQARLLARLFLPGAGEVTLTKLAEEVGLAKSRVSVELDRLESAGLVESERRGNARLVRANTDSPYYADLRSLVLKAFGPIGVLGDQLSTIPQIEEAHLHGSWAARYLGEPGDSPADVDVIVIGTPDVRAVRRAAREAAATLGREVNATVLSREEWVGESGFARTVRRRPLVAVELQRDD